MKPRVNNNRLRLVLILIVIFLLSQETVFAQEKPEKVTGSAQIETGENPDTGTPHRNVAKSGLEKKEAALLDELLQPESAIKSDQAVKEDSCASNACTSGIHQ